MSGLTAHGRVGSILHEGVLAHLVWMIALAVLVVGLSDAAVVVLRCVFTPHETGVFLLLGANHAVAILVWRSVSVSEMIVVGELGLRVERNWLNGLVASHRLAAHSCTAQWLAAHCCATHRLAAHCYATHRLAAHCSATHRCTDKRLSAERIGCRLIDLVANGLVVGAELRLVAIGAVVVADRNHVLGNDGLKGFYLLLVITAAAMMAFVLLEVKLFNLDNFRD